MIRLQWVCTRCDAGTIGDHDERHLVFEGAAVAPLRAQYAPYVCSPAYAGNYAAGDIVSVAHFVHKALVQCLMMMMH